MAKQNVEQVIHDWTNTLRRLDVDVLNRIIKVSARDFQLDMKDPDLKSEYQEALASDRPLIKARYIMGFDPVLTDDGIVALLVKNADRWGIDIPGEITTRKSRKVVEEALEDDRPARKNRGAKATMTQRKGSRATARGEPNVMVPTRSKEEGAEKTARKFTGPVLEMRLDGDAGRLCQALGFRRTPGESGKTVMRKTAAFTLVADVDEGQLVARFHASAAPRIARFMRNRLADAPRILRKAVIVDRNGEVPELEERVLNRAHLKPTSRGLRIEGAA